MPADSFIERLLASIPQQMIEFPGCDPVPRPLHFVFDALHGVHRATSDFDFFRRAGGDEFCGGDALCQVVVVGENTIHPEDVGH
jgi:hypothetical protein